jgi:ribosomal protein S2
MKMKFKRFFKKKKPKIYPKTLSLKTQSLFLKNKNLKSTPLYEDLISYGAFIGNHYNWTHRSQINFIAGYKSNYSFYNPNMCMQLLSNATKFLKIASKNKNLEFVFVGNVKNSEKESIVIFQKINKKFFPNDTWEPGFFSKKLRYSNTILVIYNISENSIAFEEAVNLNIPVVAFVTPSCDMSGVDYPIILNLENSKLWFPNYCKALFRK